MNHPENYPCECQTIYTVQPGDTLFTIAERFNVPLNRLIDCNPQIADPDEIFPGQRICIPETQPSFPCICRTIYIVQPGDSLYTIAQRFNVPLNRLIQCNPQITDPNVIFPGQRICIPETQPSFPCICQTIYIVQPGDSLYTIAQRFNVPLNRLIQCNPQITDPAVIFPGQRICIPETQPPFPCVCQTIYIVQPGDSLFTIAQRFNVPLNRLIQCNPQITDPAVIFPGQRICIPETPSPFPCVCRTIYTVQPGDSLYTIAQRYNVSLNRLIQCNPQIVDPDVIFPGQQICIPA